MGLMLSAVLKQKIDRLLVPVIAMLATAAWVFSVGHWPVVGTLAAAMHIDQGTFVGIVTSGAVFVLTIIETDLSKLRTRKLEKLLTKVPLEMVLDLVSGIVPAATPSPVPPTPASAPVPPPPSV